MHGQATRTQDRAPTPGPPADAGAPADAAVPSPWLRGLRFFYGHTGGANHYLRRRIRLPGIGCGVVIIIAALFTLGNPVDPVFQLFSLAVALSLVSLVIAWSRRARLAARRMVPRHATAGETIRYPVRVENLGRRRLGHAWLSETPPDARPSLARFATTPEPGEARRNPFDRLFLYYRWRWLMARLRRFDGGESVAPLRVDPAARATSWIELTPRRRGVFALDDLRVLLPDPLGLFQRCRRVQAPPATLTVLPRRYRLPPIEMPGEARFQVGGDTASRTVGSSGEFIGLRDYRPGDPMRLIHWKSWARTDRPIVREFEDTFFPRHGLVLDTFPRSGHEPAFEEAVSVAASFASTLERSECLLDLMFVHGRAHRFTAGRGIARAEKMLEVLAAAEPDPAQDFAQLTRLVLNHRDDLATCLCVMVGGDEGRATYVRDLVRGGADPVVLAVFGDPEEGRVAAAEWPAPAPFLPLAVGRVEADLHHLPRLLAAR